MNQHPLVERSPDILGGTPVFAGTRVPVQTLFDYLEAGHSLEAFLEDFPTVRREQAITLLEQWQTHDEELAQRQSAVAHIDALRNQLRTTYGQMPDSTSLLREDRER